MHYVKPWWSTKENESGRTHQRVDQERQNAETKRLKETKEAAIAAALNLRSVTETQRTRSMAIVTKNAALSRQTQQQQTMQQFKNFSSWRR